MQADGNGAQLWRTTYISTARCDDIATDLVAILNAARKNIARNDVTGVLLFSRTSFYQTLEGEKDQVAETFARIVRDPRHDGVIILQDEACDGRPFSNWSMAHHDLPPVHEIANKIDSICKDDCAAHRTNVAAADQDILIKSFLTI